MDAEGKKLVEDLMKQVADLQKKVGENGDANKAAIQKQVADLVAEKVKLQKREMMAELRKAEYSGSDEAVKPHEMHVSKSDDPKVQDFQRRCDNAYLLSKILRTHPSNLNIWKKMSGEYTDLKKAMDSATAAEGLEWIPTEFSSDLIERVRIAAKVAGLFARIQMPSDPYKLPAHTGDATGYLVSETTTDDPAGKSFTASTPATSNVTLNAIKLGARVPFSAELVEDSIIPVIEFIKNNLAVAMAYALEDAIINGDTAVTHFDSDVTGSTDARKAWDGLRDAAKAAAASQSLASLSTANLRSMRGLMGKYGVDPGKLVWLCSAKGYVKLLGLAEVLTVDKYGQFATILSGELAKLDGIPIVVSEKVRDSLNASGVNDSTTNDKGEIILAYVPGFVMGEKRKVTVKSFEDVERDQSVLVTSWRGDFKPLYTTSSNVLAVEGVNLTV